MIIRLVTRDGVWIYGERVPPTRAEGIWSPVIRDASGQPVVGTDGAMVYGRPEVVPIEIPSEELVVGFISEVWSEQEMDDGSVEPGSLVEYRVLCVGMRGSAYEQANIGVTIPLPAEAVLLRFNGIPNKQVYAEIEAALAAVHEPEPAPTPAPALELSIPAAGLVGQTGVPNNGQPNGQQRAASAFEGA